MAPESKALLAFAVFTCAACISGGASGQAVYAPPAPAAAPAPPPAAPPATAVAPAPAPGPAQPAVMPPPAGMIPAPPPGAAQPVYGPPPNYTLVPVGSAYGYAPAPPMPPAMELPYDGSGPIPDGYHVVKRSRRGLVIAGSIVGGIAYGASLTATIADDFSSDTNLLAVPLLGPWLMLGTKNGQEDCSVYDSSTDYMASIDRDSCESDNTALRTVMIVDGAMQLAGATMLILGLALPTSHLVYGRTSMTLAPMQFGKHGHGFAAIGQF